MLDLEYLVGPSALGLAIGFVLQYLFGWLTDSRKHRDDVEKLRLDHAAELGRVNAEYKNELKKHYSNTRSEAAVKISATLIAVSEASRDVAFVSERACKDLDVDIEYCRRLAGRLRAPDQTEVVAALAQLELLFPEAANPKYTRSVLNLMRHHPLACNSINEVLGFLEKHQAKHPTKAENGTAEASLNKYRSVATSVGASAQEFEESTAEVIAKLRESVLRPLIGSND